MEYLVINLAFVAQRDKPGAFHLPQFVMEPLVIAQTLAQRLSILRFGVLIDDIQLPFIIGVQVVRVILRYLALFRQLIEPCKSRNGRLV